MDNDTFWDRLACACDDYIRMVRVELLERWKQWPLDLSCGEMHEVIGGLLARQVTLATQMARAPSIWNGHIAPMILRTMTDNYISLAWISCDPVDRSRKFVLFGLGQEKLIVEHRKAQIEADGRTKESDAEIAAREAWLDSQRFAFLTEVNVGNWAGLNTRKMAEQADCLDLYRYAYVPFSAAVHSMWPHISRYNLDTCTNPLHRYHSVPIDPSMSVDLDYMYRAAKYVDKAFARFDQLARIKPRVPSALEKLVQALKKIGDSVEESGDDETESS